MSRVAWLDRKIRDYLRTARSLGLLNAAHFKIQRYLSRSKASKTPVQLRTRFAAFPIWCRSDSSDFMVFEQIFIDLEYACVDRVVAPKLIIDCGANVGYASAYFLTRFPDARVIAIEPDPENCVLLRRNLAPYGLRATVMESAIWSGPAGLVVDTEGGDGREWGRQVREARPGETAQLVSTDIGTVLANSGAESISILKVDVEGAELVMFSSESEQWLGRVKNIVIELHGDECSNVFHQAISGRPCRLSRSGELTFCEFDPVPAMTR